MSAAAASGPMSRRNQLTARRVTRDRTANIEMPTAARRAVGNPSGPPPDPGLDCHRTRGVKP
eukprot:7183419-Pyramimonas_sp.AAC.1